MEHSIRKLGWGLRVGAPPSPCPPFFCSYEVQLGDSLVSMSGCSLECWKDMVQKACCPGYWGSQCYGTGGGDPCPGLSICSVCLPSPSPCAFTEHLLRASTACSLVLAAWGWAESGAAQRCWGQGRIKNSWSTTEFWGGPQSALGGQRPHATATGPAWMA